MSKDRFFTFFSDNFYSLGLIIISITLIYAAGQNNAQAIAEVKAKQITMEQFVQSVDHRLSRIEGKLGVNGD